MKIILVILSIFILVSGLAASVATVNLPSDLVKANKAVVPVVLDMQHTSPVVPIQLGVMNQNLSIYGYTPVKMWLMPNIGHYTSEGPEINTTNISLGYANKFVPLPQSISGG